jgi:uncharacterized protein
MAMQLNMIMKVTRQCNLRCVYCHDWRDTKLRMPFRVLANATIKAVRQTRAHQVEFIWHGGEPLIVGIDFYRRALAIQRDVARPSQRIHNSIQTNGMLLTGEWVEFLGSRGFTIGLSLDGPQELHDRQRPTIGQRPTYERTKRALDLLRQSSVPFGVLCVVTKASLQYGAGRLLEYFVEMGAGNLRFLPLRPSEEPDKTYDADTDYVTLEEFEAFECEMFDAWAKLRGQYVDVLDFGSLARKLTGAPESRVSCTLAGACIGWNYAIEASGQVYHCDHFIGDPDYIVGNVLTDDFGVFQNGTRVHRLMDRNQARLEGVLECEHVQVCRGGCPSDHYVRQRTLQRVDLGCCGREALISHMKNHIAGGGELPPGALAASSTVPGS